MDQFGQKTVLCHVCGFRKPRSSYYDTCYKGIDCLPTAGTERTQTTIANTLTEIDGQISSKRRMVDLSRDTGMAALEFELDPRKEAQKSSNQSAAQRLPTEFVLAGEAPLAPLVLMKPEPGRQERRHLTHDAVDQDGESFQHAAELQKNPREASLASHTDDQLGAPECSSMGQISSGKSGDSFDGFVDPPEDEADLSPAGPADEEVSTETHQLAMDMLHRFNELGDDAAYDDVSDIEDEEHSRNVEAAAAYLCKQLKQGCLDALEDVNEDEGDDWAEEEQKRDAQVRPLKSFTPGCD